MALDPSSVGVPLGAIESNTMHYTHNLRYYARFGILAKIEHVLSV